MSQSISVKAAYGIVVANYDGYVDELYEIVEPDFDSYEASEALKEAGIEAEFVSFGYDFGGTALVALTSVSTTYNWATTWRDWLGHQGVPITDPGYDQELAEAVRHLGWANAGLPKPQWLVLAAFG